MTWLRDEVLVAYADNPLSGEPRRAVEHVLAVDEDARHKVVLFDLTGRHVCPGSADNWAIVSAATNQFSGAAVSGSAIEAYHVPTEGKARAALDSILSMLGAHERTSTSDRNMTAP